MVIFFTHIFNLVDQRYIFKLFLAVQIVKSGNIGTGLVCHCTLPNGGWMNFFQIWYHDQVPWPADARTIEPGSVLF